MGWLIVEDGPGGHHWMVLRARYRWPHLRAAVWLANRLGNELGSRTRGSSRGAARRRRRADADTAICDNMYAIPVGWGL